MKFAVSILFWLFAQKLKPIVATQQKCLYLFFFFLNILYTIIYANNNIARLVIIACYLQGL